ncbi:MAG: M24 family metallopeptidase [Alphaproteobacteria bacterium]|nr:M24 family metallopeptidase [Alphaproteobacteria bacterium]
MKRQQFLQIQNGEEAALPFSNGEYERRLNEIRKVMETDGLDAVLFTSMHNVAYASGFLYCSFGRPYACVVTAQNCTTISANIDGGQPWRRGVADNLVYTDWERGNYYRAIKSVLEGARRVGVEFDHLNLAMKAELEAALPGVAFSDVSPAVMKTRMHKSPEEIELIRAGAAVADIGGYAIRDAIVEGASEVEIAQAGRLAMEREITRRFPLSEVRDTWVWFQSGLNTDGAHNPLTMRTLRSGDILSLNTFPMISGYYTALERTLFIGEPSAAHLKYWELNVKVHERGLELIRPGAKCADICAELNGLYEEAGALDRRTFGYGHSFGVLSHYYGREAGLELREDIDTVIEPGMVISMEPMIMIPEGEPGAGGYREHDILVVTEQGADNITGFPFGPAHNILPVRRMRAA